MNTIRKRIEKLKQLIANWDKLAKDNENTTQHFIHFLHLAYVYDCTTKQIYCLTTKYNI
jgi:hypothetical protein